MLNLVIKTNLEINLAKISYFYVVCITEIIFGDFGSI